ncbi:MAG: acetyl-CoA carboxylase biotin carboxyl carrier protein [Desulfuromonadia bacterium]
MDARELKNLIKMITETDINEFFYEEEGMKISLKRGAAVPPPVIPMAAPMPVQTIVSPPPTVAPPTPSPSSEATVPEEKGESITSPIVGTFYRAPAPDAPPYVEVGQVVEKGQTLCIVEAMKLMNEIEAEFRCRIMKIAKENAQPVEFGDVLFYVERV